MLPIKTVVSFIKNNFQHYKQLDVNYDNICCFKKIGEDIRPLNHFVRFNTSYDVPSINLADKTIFPPFSLPLVSVIVVNYNYGRFLREAVDSVFAQTYPNIECIVVDNASTDESADVLQDIATQYPGAKIMRRKENGGQSLALMEGFAASSGEYAVFLDADDYLLATFVETHVFVHLSLRIPVGFSSSDMIQAVDSRMVLGTYGPVSEFVRSGRGKSPGLLRRMDESAPGVWPLPSPGVSIETQVHLVEPRYAGDWMWAPTSGNCFRRDALRLFLNNEDLAALRHCTDAYLLRGINVVTGSVVIDRRLAVYRLHGTNAFSKNLHLNGVLNYDRNSPSDHNQLGHKLIMDHLIANARLFLGKMPSRWHYVDALQALNDSWPQLPSTVPGCRSYLAGRVVTEAGALAPALGYREFIVLLERLNVAPNVLLKARLWLNRNKERRS
ncbi:MAG: glycosyltransferase family 2 protein [Pseudomonadota bacterium]|nr:glycosyltransferase family 2 protein [Pseudomonadota bacterium]